MFNFYLPNASWQPSGCAYSEEEAARCLSPSNPKSAKLQTEIAQGKQMHAFDKEGVEHEPDFEFVMSRVQDREALPPTPTPVWVPWVSWDLSSGRRTRNNREAKVRVSRPVTRRRSILFSLTTIKRERIECSNARHAAMLDSADCDYIPSSDSDDDPYCASGA